jgi:hypothetical protein
VPTYTHEDRFRTTRLHGKITQGVVIFIAIVVRNSNLVFAYSISETVLPNVMKVIKVDESGMGGEHSMQSACTIGVGTPADKGNHGRPNG